MRRFLLAPLFLVLTPTLRAQIVEIYGTVNAVHATNVPANNGSDTGNPLTTNTIYTSAAPTIPPSAASSSPSSRPSSASPPTSRDPSATSTSPTTPPTTSTP